MDYAVIGKTLKHSFSAQIHPRLFNCNYEKKELAENQLGKFMTEKDFKGINVTIPYKKAVIPFLDFLDETAELTGAVNTVVNKNGKLYGYNTDFSGLMAMIEQSNIDINNKNVLIFGSGATSCTAKAVAEKMGAKSVIRLSRSPKDGFFTYDEIERFYDSTHIIINTTPCGTFPNIYETAASIEKFKNLSGIFDVVYNPIRSKLVCDGLKKGVVSRGGSYMLVFQAVFAARLFSGLDISIKKGEEIYNELIKDKSNIVLIGMPSSGKTTVGKILSQITGKKFIDTDTEIEIIQNETPGSIINTKGEKYFREIESKVVFDVSKEQSAVISTGGGVVLKEENIDLLRENGIIVFIDRDIDKLLTTKSRPLSSTPEKLKEIYEKRYPLYKKYGDFCVDSESFEDIAEKIVKEISFENSCY